VRLFLPIVTFFKGFFRSVRLGWGCWLILIIIAAAVLQGVLLKYEEKPRNTSTAQTPSAPGKPPSEFTLPQDQWGTDISSDEMTGRKRHFAFSKQVGPTQEMAFPYNGVEARLAIGCDGKSEWAYIAFTKSPNLLNTDTQEGYSLINTRIKWDDKMENITLHQDWGESALHFRDYKSAISKIGKSNSVTLELNWYGSGQTVFRFSSSGAPQALEEIRKECGADTGAKSGGGAKKEE
jgi:hypothetical protein